MRNQRVTLAVEDWGEPGSPPDRRPDAEDDDNARHDQNVEEAQPEIDGVKLRPELSFKVANLATELKAPRAQLGRALPGIRR